MGSGIVNMKLRYVMQDTNDYLILIKLTKLFTTLIFTEQSNNAKQNKKKAKA